VFFPHFTRSLPIVVGMQLATLWLSGKYQQVWGTLGAGDTLRLIRAAVLGVGASVLAVLYVESFQGYSRGVFVLDAILAPMFIVSARVAVGAFDQYLRLRQTRAHKVIVYGAGRDGALAVREILQNASLDLSPLGFIDDDPRKRRARLEGLPVLGTLDDLAGILDRHPGDVTMVIVSQSRLPPVRLDELSRVCSTRRVLVRRLRVGLEPIAGIDMPGPASIVRFPGLQ
jgi:FlaA1/EpsC-like NDP-sugar epimerase